MASPPAVTSKTKNKGLVVWSDPILSRQNYYLENVSPICYVHILLPQAFVDVSHLFSRKLRTKGVSRYFLFVNVGTKHFYSVFVLQSIFVVVCTFHTHLI